MKYNKEFRLPNDGVYQISYDFLCFNRESSFKEEEKKSNVIPFELMQYLIQISCHTFGRIAGIILLHFPRESINLLLKEVSLVVALSGFYS